MKKNTEHMKLFFRVDANKTVATGHLMRCLSIADAAKTREIDSFFIVADDEPKEIIKSRGYECMVLGSEWNRLDCEIKELIMLIKKEGIQHLIVDSYYVTALYLRLLNEVTSVTYIDDLNSFVYPVDTLICYANYYNKFNYPKVYEGTKTRLLLGCEYAPLRKEFCGLPAKDIKKNIENILILTGGSDGYHVAKRILKSLNIENYKQIDVICGRYSEDYDELVCVYKSSEIVKIHHSVRNIIDYMKAADLAISAGGSSLYELCACGTPTITYSFADNQLENVFGFDEKRIMRYVDDFRNRNTASKLKTCIEFANDYSYRKGITRRMQCLVDGCGADRIVNVLFPI